MEARDVLAFHAEDPVRLNALFLKGAVNTPTSVIEPYLVALDNCSTFGELCSTLATVARRLERDTGLVGKGLLMDGIAGSGSHGVKVPVNVVMQVQESEKVSLNTGVEVGNNELGAVATASLRNLFPKPTLQHTEAKFSFGSRTLAAIHAQHMIPITPTIAVGLKAHASQQNMKQFIGCGVGRARLSAIIRADSPLVPGVHEFGVGLEERSIREVGGTASTSVSAFEPLEQNLRLTHTFELDTRDDLVLPTSGVLVRIQQELGGISSPTFMPHTGGDQPKGLPLDKLTVKGAGTPTPGFVKNELWIGGVKNLGAGVVFSTNLRLGLLFSLDGKSCTSIHDRFLLGGPCSLRGTKLFGLGDRDDGNVLGGDAYYAVGASLMSPIPGVNPNVPLRAHTFFNMGGLVANKGGGTVGGILQVFAGQPFDTVKVRLQTQPTPAPGERPRYTGMMDCIRQTQANEGLRGFYKGTLTPLVGVGACVSIQFLVVEYFKRHFSAQNGLGNPLTNAQLYIAGAAGGVANSVVSCPVEHVRTRLQVQSGAAASSTSSMTVYRGPLDCISKIYRSHGLAGLYKGMGVTMIREFQGYGAYFLAYEALVRRSMQKNNCARTDLPTWKIMSFGALGGYAMWSTVYPVDIVKSKLQTDGFSGEGRRYTSTLDVVKKTWHAEGMGGFFKGFGPCILRAAPANAVTFVGFEFAMRLLN
ncbi:hypothetical protein BZG36_00825 [Bifiguratus adelaidae]|uniref:Bacterial surface antigen (D15) domain-containing protein n=1 Tax=Bifiguratus adelaidae TaxID=1938954 RepID=A0A261Y6N0_9FUNG|nr:hypothetical protein BZG36_00825 [Bifiguratus adelaidae]